MIDAFHHIELDEVKYRLAESAEGRHYIRRNEPIRPPNAQVVQGENNTFTMRDEVLLWSITDWSGGEGQIKVDLQNPSRHWRLHDVDAFLLPGKLLPAPAEAAALKTDGSAVTIPLHIFGTDTTGTLWAIYLGTDTTFTSKLWFNDGTGWAEWTAGPSASYNTFNDAFLHDLLIHGDKVFFIVESSNVDTHVRWTDTVTAGTISVANTDIFDAEGNTAQRRMAAVGDYLYVAVAGRVYEFLVPTSASAVASTLIDDQQVLLGNMTIVDCVSSANRVFTVWTGNAETIVREIVPTTAAGAGFGQSFARFGGLRAQSAWVQGEQLYISGVLNGAATVMYVSLADRTYGTLGVVQQTEDGIPEDEVRNIQVFSAQPSFLETFGYLGYLGTVAAGGTETFTASDTWTVPAGITQVTVKVWGGGGGGGSSAGERGGLSGSFAGGGGGGGGYAEATINVTPADVLTITVGAGGAAGLHGNLSGTDPESGSVGGLSLVQHPSLGVVARATGGGGGTHGGLTGGGDAGGVGNIGDILHGGGDGGDGYVAGLSSKAGGGGGGASAATIASGGDGGNGSGSAGGAGGVNGSAVGGRGDHPDLAGTNAGTPGGGGGGGGVRALPLDGSGDGDFGVAKPGKRGQVVVSWGTQISGTNGEGESGIYMIDQVGGGLAQWASAEEVVAVRANPFLHSGRVFYTTASETRMVHARADAVWAGSAYFISPLYNFGLHEEKVLSGVTLYTEPLPADWQINVSYRASLGEAWIPLGTYSNEGGTGMTIIATTSAITRTFREVQLKVDFVYTGVSPATGTRPALLGLDVEATVVRQFHTWELILDLADASNPSNAERGADKAAALLASYAKGSAVELKDGYLSHTHGAYETHSVILDSVEIANDRPGEGTGRVILRGVGD